MATLADTDFTGVPGLRDAVKSGFTDTPFSDFTIKCGERSFHVHKVVLASLPYFRAIFERTWKLLLKPGQESNSNTIELQEEDSDIIEVMLAVTYGADYQQYVGYKCGRPTATANHENIAAEVQQAAGLVQWKRERFSVMAHELYLPSYECYLANTMDDRMRNVMQWRSRTDILPAVSAHFCTELTMHLKALVAADRYGAQAILDSAARALTSTLPDCWASPKIFDFLKFYFIRARDIRKGLTHVTVQCVVSDIAERISHLYPSNGMLRLLKDEPRISQMLNNKLAKQTTGVQCGLVEVSDRYCASWTCRKNIQRASDAEQCARCGNDELELARMVSDLFANME